MQTEKDAEIVGRVGPVGPTPVRVVLWRRGRSAALHRTYLAVISSEGRAVAMEVELSVRAPRRSAAICPGYVRARHVGRVYYLAATAAAQAVGGCWSCGC
jgi:hypothetical protein